jgi:hypothetical protein
MKIAVYNHVHVDHSPDPLYQVGCSDGTRSALPLGTLDEIGVDERGDAEAKSVFGSMPLWSECPARQGLMQV